LTKENQRKNKEKTEEKQRKNQGKTREKQGKSKGKISPSLELFNFPSIFAFANHMPIIFLKFLCYLVASCNSSRWLFALL
jgi:hypothetical protein